MNPLLAEAATAAIHCTDAEIRHSVTASIEALLQAPQHIETCKAALAQGKTLASCLQTEPGHLVHCHQLARSLCDRGDFLLALPLAMFCACYEADQPDHSFLTGACLQRLGQPVAAAQFYRTALQLNETDAASAYRLGECLEAAGHREDARHLYQWTVDLARGKFALQRLQDMAGERLARLDIR